VSGIADDTGGSGAEGAASTGADAAKSAAGFASLMNSVLPALSKIMDLIQKLFGKKKGGASPSEAAPSNDDYTDAGMSPQEKKELASQINAQPSKDTIDTVTNDLGAGGGYDSGSFSSGESSDGGRHLGFC
jgi:hypothetical protein